MTNAEKAVRARRQTATRMRMTPRSEADAGVDAGLGSCRITRPSQCDTRRYRSVKIYIRTVIGPSSLKSYDLEQRHAVLYQSGLPKCPAQHLAHHGLGQVLPELDARRHLVACQFLPAERAQVRLARGRSRAQHDPGVNHFAIEVVG